MKLNRMLLFLFLFIYRSYFALLLDFQSDVNLINKSILKLIIYIYIEHLELVDSNFRLKNCNMQIYNFKLYSIHFSHFSLPIIIDRDAIERKKEAIIPKKISTRFHQHLFQHPTKLI